MNVLQAIEVAKKGAKIRPKGWGKISPGEHDYFTLEMDEVYYDFVLHEIRGGVEMIEHPWGLSLIQIEAEWETIE